MSRGYYGWFPVLPTPEELAELWLVTFGTEHGRGREPQPWRFWSVPYPTHEISWDLVQTLAESAQYWSDMELRHPTNAYVNRMAAESNRSFLRAYSRYTDGW